MNDLRFDVITSVEAAARLSADIAGWGPMKRTWERLLESPFVDCVGGYDGAELVATATVTQYDDVGWVGMVIVAEERRGRGEGRAIFETAVERARANGCTTLGLDANDRGYPLYESLDFADVAPIDSREGILRGGNPPATVTRLTGATADVLAYDARASGVDRGALLVRLLSEPGTFGFVDEREGVRGYAVVRQGDDSWLIGPLVADDATALDGLLDAISERVGSLPVAVKSVREPHRDRVFDARGLDVYRTLTRMCDGPVERPLTGPALHAAAGYELG